MSGDRVACSGCGIPVPTTDLLVSGEARVCPRCFALAAPATLRRRPARAATPGAASPAAGPGGTLASGDRAARSRAAAPPPPPSPVPLRDRMTALAARLDRSVRRWAAGRHWWVRAPVLAWLAWILFRYWDAPWRQTIWKGIDLAVHELGHILWSPLGEFMAMAGGTLTQLLVPVAAGVVLYRQRDWFGVSVAIGWLGINCFETVEYAGDALARRLPLVSPTTAEPLHDWSYLLGRLGLLEHTPQVAAAWLWAGRLTLGVGVAFGAWVLWVMAATPRAGTDRGIDVGGGSGGRR